MFSLKYTLSTSQLFIVTFVLSAVISYFVTPLVIKLAYRIGAIDVPKDNRRVHKKPIPRLGGLAIAISFFITLLLFSTVTKEILVLFISLSIIIVMGVIDDVKGIGAKVKFLIQILAATLVAVFAFRIKFLANPFEPMH